MKAPIFVATRIIQAAQAKRVPGVHVDQDEQRLGSRVQELFPELAKLMDRQVNCDVIITEVLGGECRVQGWHPTRRHYQQAQSSASFNACGVPVDQLKAEPN